MTINNPNENELNQTDDQTVIDLSPEIVPGQDTQPMEIETEGDLPASEAVPGLTEPDKLSEAGEPVEEPVEKATTATTRPPSGPKMITRSAAFGLVVGGMFLSFILAVVFSLGVLAIVNGGMRFASSSQVEGLTRQLNGLSVQADSIQREIDGLVGRVSALEGLDTRLGAVEKESQLIQQDVQTVTGTVTRLESQADELETQVVTIEGQVATLEGQVNELESRTTLFQRFLDGLQELLGGLIQP